MHAGCSALHRGLAHPQCTQCCTHIPAVPASLCDAVTHPMQACESERSALHASTCICLQDTRHGRRPVWPTAAAKDCVSWGRGKLCGSIQECAHSQLCQLLLTPAAYMCRSTTLAQMLSSASCCCWTRSPLLRYTFDKTVQCFASMLWWLPITGTKGLHSNSDLQFVNYHFCRT